jgi:hypothetical protein
MNRKISTIIIASLSISVMILAMMTNGVLSQYKKPPVQMVKVSEVLAMSDQDRINLLIDQLLVPKSAACFRNILMKESKMNPSAANHLSSAKGVGQLLDKTYNNLGMKHSSDGIAQTIAALAYISRHYGGTNSTCQAWAHWQKYKWF